VKKTDIASALLSPFDGLTWCVLLTSFVLICLIPRLRFWRALDLVWFILAQPPQRVKTFGLLIVTLSILLIPIPCSYTTYFTSQAVKPVDRPYIDRNQELFDSGFKMICSLSYNLSACAKDTVQWFNASFSKLKLDWMKKEQYFMHFPRIRRYQSLLANTRDQGMNSLPREYKESTRILAERAPDTQCHMLNEPWLEETLAVFYAGIGSQDLYETFGKLMQAGIAEFWRVIVQRVNEHASINRLKGNSPSESAYDSEVAYMKASIRSVLIIFLVLHAFNIIYFIIEVLSLKVVTSIRWRGWKQRWMYYRHRAVRAFRKL